MAFLSSAAPPLCTCPDCVLGGRNPLATAVDFLPILSRDDGAQASLLLPPEPYTGVGVGWRAGVRRRWRGRGGGGGGKSWGRVASVAVATVSVVMIPGEARDTTLLRRWESAQHIARRGSQLTRGRARPLSWGPTISAREGGMRPTILTWEGETELPGRGWEGSCGLDAVRCGSPKLSLRSPTTALAVDPRRGSS